jgi:hypothetical protein
MTASDQGLSCSHCARCGVPMPKSVTRGRKRRFCGDACRQAAHRALRASLREAESVVPTPTATPDPPGPSRPWLDEEVDHV